MRAFLRIVMVSVMFVIFGVSVGCGSNSPSTKDAGKEMMKDDKMKGEGMMKDDKMKGGNGK
ncbi:MAG TPA: hypothetical protein VG097_10845 [Gemmata sp.]|jgi:hypothetical protein|nr:hypothetical protein [Gemmata sp.]